MRYIIEPVDATLIKKVNRFLARVTINGVEEKAHIPNSGRLTELMTPGAPLLLSRATNKTRKTAWTLEAVRYKKRWVVVNSLVPNRLGEWLFETKNLPLFNRYQRCRREVTFGKQRFDLLLEAPHKKPLIVEIKSCTLVEKGVALFPDAPTLRGRHHVERLIRLQQEGYRAALLIMVMRSDAKEFRPNKKTDPDFAHTLHHAHDAGVTVTALRCSVGRQIIKPLDALPVRFD